VNARSIVNKRDELELYVLEEKPDLIGITETWLTISIEDAELNIEGYTLLRKDRILGNKLRGGGVLLYIKNSINVVLREDFSNKHFEESIWCDLELGGEKTLIGICYRPPDSSKVQDEALLKCIDHAASKGKVLIMGDFNFAEIDWKNSHSDESNLFTKCINDNYLIQCVDSSTRGKNVLDLIFVTEENMIENLKVGELFDSSDHQIIRWTFIACKDKIQTCDKQKTFNYFKADYNQIRLEAELINWSEVVEGVDCQSDFLRFKSALEVLRNKFVPLKKLNNNKCKWVNKTVIKCRRAKFKAWENYNLNRNEISLDKYKSKLKKSRDINRIAKRNFEKKLSDNIKNDSKSFYSYIRSKQRTKDKVGPLKNSVGDVVTDDKEAANLLNNYFSSVFTIEDCSIIPEPILVFDQNLMGPGLSLMEITHVTVENKLENLNVSKCPGLDELHPKLLFELRKIIAKPLSVLYNSSLRSGVVPNEWKEAGVTPLFKKGKKSDAQNYRPVSLTSLVCKIMESILKDEILNHINKHSLIRQSQHGFTKGRSCLTNLLEFLETVTYNLDEGKSVDIIYLDFAKAFDKVPYQRLFKKLFSHGIRGQILEWVKHWLLGRKQKVSINKAYSGWQSVESGVPQGSVLGPLLFLIYINDLDVNIMSKLSKFADDTKLFNSVADTLEVEKLRDDLKRVYQWSLDWQMLFNADKCTVMHMGRSNLKFDYRLGNNVLKNCEQERDLGVIINCNGKQSEQCNVAVKKANAILGMIKRNIEFKSKENVIRLYKSLVRPRLEFCVQAWSPYLKKDIDVIERVQRRATKLIEGYGKLSYADRLYRTKLIPLEKRRVRGDLIQVFKMIKGFDKIDYRSYFEISQDKRTRGHSLKLIKRRCNGELRKHFFTQRVVDSWNGLPQIVVDADTINTFKNRLDEFDKYWKSA
jgi:ribonucleases P/MRP protein subunit RPP40